jgi:hypothetical protein
LAVIIHFLYVNSTWELQNFGDLRFFGNELFSMFPLHLGEKENTPKNPNEKVTQEGVISYHQ